MGPTVNAHPDMPSFLSRYHYGRSVMAPELLNDTSLQQLQMFAHVFDVGESQAP